MKFDKSKIKSEIAELDKFTTHQGKVLPRRMTKLNVQEQRKVQRKIKLARALSFMPYVRREG